LVFTDIEGSTRLLASLGSLYEEVLATHRRLLRQAFSSHDGVEVDTQGDALFYAFPRAQDAVTAAVEAQQGLSSHDFGAGVELRVRMGIHTGEPSLSDEGYVGSDVHLGARISAVAWAGQVVVLSATAALVGGDAGEISRSLGEHALKDIEDRVELHQVMSPGLEEDFPALRSVSAHPTNLPARLPALIGREDEIAALVELLSSEGVSVVTLVGPGGTGKTRVALAVGAELLSSFGEGVFFRRPLGAVGCVAGGACDRADVIAQGGAGPEPGRDPRGLSLGQGDGADPGQLRAGDGCGSRGVVAGGVVSAQGRGHLSGGAANRG
jgi:class 3 adenylate cyclase